MIFDDFANFFIKTYVVGAHKNRLDLDEATRKSTHNTGFYEGMTKIIFQLSSNTHLVFSSASIVQNIRRDHIKQLKTPFYIYFCIAQSV